MSKLNGNGIFEGSRFILPEHREALLEQRRQRPTLDGNRGYNGDAVMKDWREELRREPAAIRKPIAPVNPHLCRCKAAMKGKWIDRIYMCVKCNKPVYG